METDGVKVIENNREYTEYQPDERTGPTTLVLGTIVILVEEEE